jgi:hypothetical protein
MIKSGFGVSLELDVDIFKSRGTTRPMKIWLGQGKNQIIPIFPIEIKELNSVFHLFVNRWFLSGANIGDPEKAKIVTVLVWKYKKFLLCVIVRDRPYTFCQLYNDMSTCAQCATEF